LQDRFETLAAEEADLIGQDANVNSGLGKGGLGDLRGHRFESGVKDGFHLGGEVTAFFLATVRPGLPGVRREL
jgi:hypothetical protein